MGHGFISVNSQVSTKNLSQKIGFSRWRPGPGNLGQKGPNLLILLRHPQKPDVQSFQIF